jgi:hypothetical protein
MAAHAVKGDATDLRCGMCDVGYVIGGTAEINLTVKLAEE